MLRRLIAIVFALALLGGAAVAIALVLKGDKHTVPRPGAFYRIPAVLPRGAPGTVVRSQALTGLPKGMLGWRVLYLTHGYDDSRTLVSGMLFAPAGRRANRNIVVFAHPTVGVAARCGPSVYGADYVPYVDGLRRFIKAGDAVAVPDYQGLGTSGPHPYLVALAEARTVVDAARAAHKFGPTGGGTRYAVLGSSQGGQAALATALLVTKTDYGKRMTLVGVAAAAPLTRLSQLFSQNERTAAGKLLSTFTLSSWALVYGRATLNDLFAARATSIVSQIDGTCIENPARLLRAAPPALLARLRFLRKHPSKAHVWAELLHRNTLHPFTSTIPMVVVQGESDHIVDPDVTTSYVRDLCGRQDVVTYRTYADVGHQAIGLQSAPYLSGWIAGRFGPRGAPNSCPH